jgi:hypothetical protein
VTDQTPFDEQLLEPHLHESDRPSQAECAIRMFPLAYKLACTTPIEPVKVTDAEERAAIIANRWARKILDQSLSFDQRNALWERRKAASAARKGSTPTAAAFEGTEVA